MKTDVAIVGGGPGGAAAAMFLPEQANDPGKVRGELIHANQADALEVLADQLAEASAFRVLVTPLSGSETSG